MSTLNILLAVALVVSMSAAVGWQCQAGRWRRIAMDWQRIAASARANAEVWEQLSAGWEEAAMEKLRDLDPDGFAALAGRLRREGLPPPRLPSTPVEPCL